MKEYDVKTWFYDKLNKERGCDQITSWLYLCHENTVEKETEKAYLMNWMKVVFADDGEQTVTPEKIWIPKSCVNVLEGSW